MRWEWERKDGVSLGFDQRGGPGVGWSGAATGLLRGLKLTPMYETLHQFNNTAGGSPNYIL